MNLALRISLFLAALSVGGGGIYYVKNQGMLEKRVAPSRAALVSSQRKSIARPALKKVIKEVPKKGVKKVPVNWPKTVVVPPPVKPLVAPVAKRKSAPVRVKSVKREQSGAKDYPKVEAKPLVWMTTHYTSPGFENPEELYTEEIEVKFSKIDHQKLFHNYLAAMAEFKAQEGRERVPVLMADKAKKIERKVASSPQVLEMKSKDEPIQLRSPGPPKLSGKTVKASLQETVARMKRGLPENSLVAFDYSKHRASTAAYNPFLPETYRGWTSGGTPKEHFPGAVSRERIAMARALMTTHAPTSLGGAGSLRRGDRQQLTSQGATSQKERAVKAKAPIISDQKGAAATVQPVGGSPEASELKEKALAQRVLKSLEGAKDQGRTGLRQSKSKKAGLKAAPTPAVVKLGAQVFSFNRGPLADYRNFEVLPDYSSSERWGDAGTGRINIHKNLNSSMGVLGALLYGRDIVDTRVDIVLERGVVREESIPVFFRAELAEFFEQQKLSGEGGHLLVELDESTESVTLDASHEAVLYLDRKLRIVADAADYNYLLFVGLPPGSTTIDYIRNGYENLKKVILIERGSIYYESNQYLKMGKDIVEINQRNTLAFDKSHLNVDGSQIVQFNSYEKVTQIAPNRYDLTTNVLPAGTRKYLEFKHMSSSIYLGKWDAKEVVLPGEDYIAYFLKTMGMEELAQSCLVQVNFSGKVKVKKVAIEGKNGEDYIPIERIYLDGGGQFAAEVSPLSVRGFFLSDQAGVMSIMLQYENGGEDYLNSYCAPSVYIVEQL